MQRRSPSLRLVQFKASRHMKILRKKAQLILRSDPMTQSGIFRSWNALQETKIIFASCVTWRVSHILGVLQSKLHLLRWWHLVTWNLEVFSQRYWCCILPWPSTASEKAFWAVLINMPGQGREHTWQLGSACTPQTQTRNYYAREVLWAVGYLPLYWKTPYRDISLLGDHGFHLYPRDKAVHVTRP